MKKSKKCDLKKLALLGIAGGTVLATQASAADINNYSQLLAFNGCGGAHGCGHEGAGVGGGNNRYQAYRNTPSQNSYYQSEAGCRANSQPQYYQQAAGYQETSQPQYYQQAASCNAMPQPQYHQQPSAGCATAYAPRGQNNYQGSGSQEGGNATYAPQWQSQQLDSDKSTPMSASNRRGTITQWEINGETADAAMSSTQRPMSESGLLSKLNEQGKAAYQSLDPAGKALALKMANQDCKGQNECKGMNSCKTADHACAGKGSCAGTAPSNFKDKNLAVKVAALKMAEKRANASSPK